MNLVLVLVSLASLVYTQACYWNDACVYPLYASKTPYDAVRGDIRDLRIPENCKAVSLWSLNRHGNRNPGTSVTAAIKVVVNLKQEIIDSFYAGRGQLCAQDIENFKKWHWNETLDVSQSYLTGTGYEELYDIAKRLAENYPHLLEGGDDDFYLRTTDEQRTITSALAFAHGWAENTNLNLTVDGPWDRDDVIRPYQNCDRYQQEVKEGPLLEENINAYLQSQEYVTVIQNVQNRLGITTQLSADDVYYIYEACRFFRSWEPDLRSPWCAAFGYDDLVVLEYRDDVRHYYRNAYGSWINVNLGKMPLKDLFERFTSVVQGNGTNLVAYFTHDTMIEMTAAALGLFQDPEGVILGGRRDPNRLFRSSYVGSFSSNMLAVLNTCQETTGQAYRVQFFHNDKVTDICPLEGCTWDQFLDKFQVFSSANLDFCPTDSRATTEPPLPDSASLSTFSSWVLIGLVAVKFSLS